MQGRLTARQGEKNRDRIGGYQPKSGTRTMHEASKDRNWTYSSHAGMCLQTQHRIQWCAHPRGGGVQPEKKGTSRDSRAGHSGRSVTADDEDAARTGRTEWGLGRDPTGSSWAMSKANLLIQAVAHPGQIVTGQEVLGRLPRIVVRGVPFPAY